jgi:hypothetical protein
MHNRRPCWGLPSAALKRWPASVHFFLFLQKEVMQGDDPVMAKYASRIYPLRKRGNLLLCTILIGNVSVNSTLSVVLDGMASSCPSFLAALLLSCTLCPSEDN